MRKFRIVRTAGINTYYLKLGSGFDGSFYWVANKDEAYPFTGVKATTLLNTLSIVFGFNVHTEDVD